MTVDALMRTKTIIIVLIRPTEMSDVFGDGRSYSPENFSFQTQVKALANTVAPGRCGRRVANLNAKITLEIVNEPFAENGVVVSNKPFGQHKATKFSIADLLGDPLSAGIERGIDGNQLSGLKINDSQDKNLKSLAIKNTGKIQHP